MKKSFLLLLALLLLVFSLVGCKSAPDGSEFVSELRFDLFEGESETYSIKAYYGFIEKSPIDDGVVGDKINVLKFKLTDKIQNDITYNLHFNYEDKEYYKTFAINPVKNSLTTEIEIDDFALKEFTIEIRAGADVDKITLRSILPDNTISYKEALLSIKENEVALWDSYYNNNGEFLAEIRMRAIIKEGAPYWYVAFVKENGNTKAFLLDGFSGEILAVKDLF